MARLPILDSDSDQWGALLNGFLRISHREDGTLSNTHLVANIKDFGAVGDGITNDTDAIQAAVNSLQYGGIVYLPPGSYAVTGITTRNTQSTLRLIGAGGSVYGADLRSVLVPFMSSVEDMIRISDLQQVGPPMMIQIESLIIDGQSTTKNGIHVYKGQNFVFSHVSVINCENGFYIDGKAAANGNRVMQISSNSRNINAATF